MICFNNNTPMPGILTFVFTVQDAGGPAYLSATTWLITSFIPSLLFFPSPPPLLFCLIGIPCYNVYTIVSMSHKLHTVFLTMILFYFSSSNPCISWVLKFQLIHWFFFAVDFFFSTLTNSFARSAVWCLIYEDN